MTFEKLLVATHNDGKAREISALLDGLVGDVVTAAQYDLPEPEETEKTFTGNALLKARAAARVTGLPALADDSGLAVRALDGAPGIYSARWAEKQDGSGRDFEMAMRRVWDELQPHDDKGAAFICALALVMPDGAEHVFEGRVEGDIVWPMRGDKGFGYDPVFVARGYDVTFAEMQPEEKHAISHRADAFAKFKAFLQEPAP